MSWLVVWGLLGVGIASEMVGAAFLKASDGFSKIPQTVGALALYSFCLFLLSRTLEVLSLGVAIAVWAGGGVAATALIGVFFFGERLSASRACSFCLIAAGIVLVGLHSGGSS